VRSFSISVRSGESATLHEMQLQRSDQEISSLFSLSGEIREHILGYAIATVDEFWALSAVCKRLHSRNRLADFVYADVRLSLEEWRRSLTATAILTFNARSITLTQTNVPSLPACNAEAVIVHKCFQADEVRLWNRGSVHHTLLWTHAIALNSTVQVLPRLVTLGLSNATFRWSDMRVLLQHLTHGSFPALQTLLLGGMQCTDLRAEIAAAAFISDELDAGAVLPSSLRVCELTYVSAELLTQLETLLGEDNWQQLQPTIIDFTLSSGAAFADAAASSSIATASCAVWDAAAAQHVEQQLYGNSSATAPATAMSDLRRVVRYASLALISYLLTIFRSHDLLSRRVAQCNVIYMSFEHHVLLITVCFTLPLLSCRYATCCQGRGKRTPLHAAAHSGCTPAVHWLLRSLRTAAVNSKDSKGCTPLFLAAEAGADGAVQELLRAGADMLTRNHAQEGPLYIAALKGHAAVVALLLGELRKLQLFDNVGVSVTALTAAAAAGTVQRSQQLRSSSSSSGSNSSAFKLNPAAPVFVLGRGLMRSATSGQGTAAATATAAVQQQQQKQQHKQHQQQQQQQHKQQQQQQQQQQRPPPERGPGAIDSSEGFTPLHAAAIRRSAAVVQLLLQAGLPCDARNRYKQTPLMLAARAGDAASVAALLAAGASATAVDEDGLTPLQYALDHSTASCRVRTVHGSSSSTIASATAAVATAIGGLDTAAAAAGATAGDVQSVQTAAAAHDEVVALLQVAMGISCSGSSSSSSSMYVQHASSDSRRAWGTSGGRAARGRQRQGRSVR
jgi:ankyrin repeat protein